jgi:hypothetical protein
MSLTDPLFLTAGVMATAGMFAVVAFFTRATWKRIGGVLLASLPLIPLVMLYDAIAARFGWWVYPSLTTSSAPIAWYIAAALWYGAALALIGWRVRRRFGSWSFAVFLLAAGLFGVIRDSFYAANTGLIQFAPGPIPLTLDFLAYTSAIALVQFLMDRISGAPGLIGLLERQLDRATSSASRRGFSILSQRGVEFGAILILAGWAAPLLSECRRISIPLGGSAPGPRPPTPSTPCLRVLHGSNQPAARAPSENMTLDPFAYLSVLVSIVLGLGITQLLKGFSRWLELRKAFGEFGPTIAWATFLLLMHFQTWWSMYGMRGYADWNFMQFLMVLLQPIVLFLLAVLVFPSPSSPHQTLRDHFFHQRRFFALFLTLLGVSLLKDLSRSGALPEPLNIGFHTAGLLIAALGFALSNELVHRWLSYLAVLSFMAYIAILFAAL